LDLRKLLLITIPIKIVTMYSMKININEKMQASVINPKIIIYLI